MSFTPADNADERSDDGEDPVVPKGVLRGIEDVKEGDTASKADLEDILKF